MNKMRIFIVWAILILSFWGIYSHAIWLLDYFQDKQEAIKGIWLVEPKGGAKETWKALLSNLIDILLFFAWSVAVYSILMWWFKYVTHYANDDSSWKKAKLMITNWLIWLIIIITSKLVIDNWVRLFKNIFQ